MADTVYNRFKLGCLQAAYDLQEAGDDVQVGLVTSSYTLNGDTHLDWADITNELSGTGYTAGGADIANQTTTQDDTDDEGVFDGDNVTWTGINAGTAAAAITYQNTGTAATSLLIGYHDSGGFPITTNGGNLTIQWSSEGIVNLT
ncbi:MAG: hypothetical protein HKM94_04285 [Halobacteria archaeon]|nr:hypothetical protein [Halobacteria archaeon]